LRNVSQNLGFAPCGIYQTTILISILHPVPVLPVVESAVPVVYHTQAEEMVTWVTIQAGQVPVIVTVQLTFHH